MKCQMCIAQANESPTNLVATSETLVIVCAVNGNVLSVSLAELLNSLVNGLDTTLLPHGLGGEVGVAASAVPFAWDSLGVEADLDTPLFRNADEEVPGDSQVVSHLDTETGADSNQFRGSQVRSLRIMDAERVLCNSLEFPLSRHDLGVDTRDLDASVEAGAVVSLDEITSVDLSSADTAVVRALGTGETTLGPAVRLVVHVKERVLLLDTEPRLLGGSLGHDLLGSVPVVALVGGAVVVVALGKNNDVVAKTEGVRVEGSRAEVNVRVVAGSLVCGDRCCELTWREAELILQQELTGGGAIEVPLLELVNRLDGAIDSGSLSANLA